MRKTIAALAALFALVFAPVLWGLPPPGDAVSVEPAEPWALILKLDENDTQLAPERHDTLASMPAHGGVRLLTRKAATGEPIYGA